MVQDKQAMADLSPIIKKKEVKEEEIIMERKKKGERLLK